MEICKISFMDLPPMQGEHEFILISRKALSDARVWTSGVNTRSFFSSNNMVLNGFSKLTLT